jgi:hypothetical protein
MWLSNRKIQDEAATKVRVEARKKGKEPLEMVGKSCGVWGMESKLRQKCFAVVRACMYLCVCMCVCVSLCVCEWSHIHM